MIGWAFAVSMLLAILSFELVMFRYLSAGEPAAESRGSRDASGTGARTGEAPPAAGSAVDGDTPIRPCQECGTGNDAAAPVHYCRNCLARIQ